MGYESPSGWIETLIRSSSGAQHEVFHASLSCPRIRDSGSLRAVERPYSAARCSLCASPSADPRQPA